MTKTNQNNKPTKAQRAAQSARDKQKNAGKGVGKRARRPKREFAEPHLAGKGETRVASRGRREMVLEEDEYIAEVTVANQPNFNNVQYFVNPGQATTFPWMAKTAGQFEKYRFEYLEFYYKREVSEFATDGQVGKIILSFDSDATDSAPATKQQMEDTEPHADCMPCENQSLVIPRAYLEMNTDAHYVRPGAQPAFTDLKTYDIGVLNVATQGILHNVVVGELRVRYRVRLFIPVLENLAAPVARTASWFQSTAAESVGATGVAKLAAVATASSNALQIVNTAGSLVPPAGAYLVTMSATVAQSALSNTMAGSIDFQKNGVSVFTAARNLTGEVGSAGVTAVSTGTYQCIVSANGTDAFTFPVTAVYSVGVPTGVYSVVFQQA